MQGLFQKKCMYDDEIIRLRFISALSNSQGKKLGVAHGNDSDQSREIVWSKDIATLGKSLWWVDSCIAQTLNN